MVWTLLKGLSPGPVKKGKHNLIIRLFTGTFFHLTNPFHMTGVWAGYLPNLAVPIRNISFELENITYHVKWRYTNVHLLAYFTSTSEFKLIYQYRTFWLFAFWVEIGADDLCLTCANNINSYLSRELTGMGVASLENKVTFYKLLYAAFDLSSSHFLYGCRSILWPINTVG